jgi:hypothetical protein
MPDIRIATGSPGWRTNGIFPPVAVDCGDWVAVCRLLERALAPGLVRECVEVGTTVGVGVQVRAGLRVGLVWQSERRPGQAE